MPLMPIILALALGDVPRAVAVAPVASRFDNLSPRVDVWLPGDRWWEAFSDPALDALVAEALAGGPTVEEAAARLDRVRAGARAAGGARLPTIGVDASASAARLSTSDPRLGAARFLPGFDRDQERYAGSVGASWEVDLFGRLGARARAAGADARAGAWALEGARLAVATEVAERYLALRLLQRRLEIARRRTTTLDRLVGLSALRVDRGVAAPVERDRLVAEARTAAAAVPALQAAIEDQFARIDVLAGREVGTSRRALCRDAPFPKVRSIDLAATPADLLLRRPDVRAAESALEARGADVRAAVRDQLPRLSLASLIGTVAGAINPLFGAAAFATQGSAGIGYTAFDGGRSHAAVDAAKADARGAAGLYRRTVLTAVADVEAASASRASADARLLDLSEAEARLERTFAAVGRAQAQGALSLNDILDVERRLHDARDARVLAEADQSLASVALIRALGGGPATTILAEQADVR